MPSPDASSPAVIDLEVVKSEDDGPKTPLTPAQEKDLKRHETRIEQGDETEKDGAKKVADGFLQKATAMHCIREERLYRGDGNRSFEEYCSEKWNFSRANGNRLADIGKLLKNPAMSRRRDILELCTSAEHFVPLLSLAGGEKGQKKSAAAMEARDVKVISVLDKIEAWQKRQAKEHSTITPALVKSAVVVTNPDSATQPRPDKKQNKVIAAVLDYINDARRDSSPKTIAVLDELVKKVTKHGRSSTGISWTDATWNPLQGCTHASKGCDNCYAAKFIATRKKHLYPGLAVGKPVHGITKYLFTGKILLLPHALKEPLSDPIPKLYFVNSLSDLFHKHVPDDFIDEVFDIMERASWHVFQVLTKRTKIMADYSEKRYAQKPPPPNIWLGTSTEDQETFDERYPDLLRVKTAVRWLSCEPLIGSLKLNPKGIDWVVVGGESGKFASKMDKKWAAALRDQCSKAEIPFFFKQWGAYNEAGKMKGETDAGAKPKKKDKTEPTRKSKTKPPVRLDGAVHDAYPPQLKQVLPE